MIKRETNRPTLGVKSVLKASVNSRIKQSTNPDIFNPWIFKHQEKPVIPPD
jgi:hypothetical protein